MCGSKWDPTKGIIGDNNAFEFLGSSKARYGCCQANTYMSSPEGTGIFVEDDSCSPCPVGTFTSVLNDETSCHKNTCLGPVLNLTDPSPPKQGNYEQIVSVSCRLPGTIAVGSGLSLKVENSSPVGQIEILAPSSPDSGYFFLE